jgi:hypothetical protein
MMGMVNQKGPDGSLTYTQTGGFNDPSTGEFIPQYTAETALSGAAQQRFDTTNAAQQNMADVAKTLSGQIMDTTGKPISYDNLPELAGSGGYEASRKATEDAMYSRLTPQMERARATLETTLTNRGIRPGSEAYDRAMRNAGETENDARMQVTLAGGQEQSRMAGLDSATRAQLLGERNSQANEPINRLAALLSNTQVNTPQYQTYTPQGMATTDIAGLTQQNYGNQMQAYQQKMQQQNQLYGGLFGLGAAGIMANPFTAAGKEAITSDRQLKKDILKIGEIGGHNIYEFRYKTDDATAPKHVGVMAQEVERTHPEAVVDTPNGKAVYYQMLGLEALTEMRV